LDRAEAPDIWPDASTRTAKQSDDLDFRPRRGSSRIAALILAVTISVLAIGLVVFAFSASRSPVPENPASPTVVSSEPWPLLGSDLAEALGLKLQAFFPSSGCEFFVEVDNPRGYCLDTIAGSKVDHWVLAQELQGHVPTDAQIRCFSIMDKLGNWGGPTDSPEYRDLQQQFEDECSPFPSESASPPP
jgi:hypothetical protein